MMITSEFGDFSDRFSTMIDFGAQYKLSNVTPKIFYKIHLDKSFKNTVDGILGIGVSVSWN